MDISPPKAKNISLAEASDYLKQLTIDLALETWGWMEGGNAMRLHILPVVIEGKKQYSTVLVENQEIKLSRLSGTPPKRKGVLIKKS
jgi:hypothetical protein